MTAWQQFGDALILGGAIGLGMMVVFAPFIWWLLRH
jgi:hypothetical protein